MIKSVISALGLGLAGYVAYSAYAEKTNITTDTDEGGYLNVALGVVENGFSKVSFSEGLNMNISLTGLSHIKGWEAFRPNVYKDQAGLPTIGYGHLIKPTESFSTITEAAAVQLLLKDLEVAEGAVNRLVKVPLSQNQYDALVSFVFNVGAGAFARSTMLKRLNAGQMFEAGNEFGAWVKINIGTKLKPNYVVSKGLVNRRISDYNLYRGVA